MPTLESLDSRLAAIGAHLRAIEERLWCLEHPHAREPHPCDVPEAHAVTVSLLKLGAAIAAEEARRQILE